MRHCCFRCALSFLVRLSMELQKTRKAFGSPSTPGQKKSIIQNPPNNCIIQNLGCSWTTPLKKCLGACFEIRFSKGLELVSGMVALDVLFLSWLV